MNIILRAYFGQKNFQEKLVQDPDPDVGSGYAILVKMNLLKLDISIFKKIRDDIHTCRKKQNLFSIVR
jgi:hypothetical protein